MTNPNKTNNRILFPRGMKKTLAVGVAFVAVFLAALAYFVNASAQQSNDVENADLETLRTHFLLQQDSLTFTKNPTLTEGYDYVACGTEYQGEKTDCKHTIFCSQSMTPLFNCQEKLLFTTTKDVEAGDIVDVELKQPITVNIEGVDYNLTHLIHVVKGVNGSRLITSPLNLGSRIYVSTEKEEFYDEHQPSREDVKGVLKGLEW